MHSKRRKEQEKETWYVISSCCVTKHVLFCFGHRLVMERNVVIIACPMERGHLAGYSPCTLNVRLFQSFIVIGNIFLMRIHSLQSCVVCSILCLCELLNQNCRLMYRRKLILKQLIKSPGSVTITDHSQPLEPRGRSYSQDQTGNENN